MIHVRPAAARGQTRADWLDSRHTFSFADYHDPEHMGFRALRVINDDRVAAGGGFGLHPHRDMEIVSYVVEGTLAHRDSTGAAGEIRAGEVQHMSAGTGVRHSEVNPSADTPVRFLQIWIRPRRGGLTPAYHQRALPLDAERGRLIAVAAPGGAGGALPIEQDVALWAARLGDGDAVSLPLAAGRHGYLQVVRGAVDLGGQGLGEGDGAALSDEPAIAVRARGEAEVLLFDLA
jgi:quercetin 2,3-dioxygenase